MKIGLLVTSINNFGESGFYNSQEVGLAKQLDELYDEVIIYKLVSRKEKYNFNNIQGTKNTKLHLIPSYNIGINGIANVRYFDKDLEALVYFADTQLSVPSIFKWCQRHKVKLIPYIGVTVSNNNNQLKKKLMDIISYRNIRIYRKSSCIVKTPQIKEELKRLGVECVEVAPVGLDETLLNQQYTSTPILELKKKWKFTSKDNIILFVGRLTPEKQPIKLIEIFERIYKCDSTYRLFIVGKGELNNQVINIVNEKKLDKVVHLIEKIPNKDIWELYRISKAVINLNENEIFGMSILEAMYYECKVLAMKAPGPNFIIDHNENGILCEKYEDIIDGVFYKSNKIGIQAHLKVKNNFTWKPVAKLIDKIIR